MNIRLKGLYKALSLVIIIAITACIFTTAYSIEDFNYKEILGKEDDFQYDKFNKSWTFSNLAGVEIDETDKLIFLILKTFSEDYGPNPSNTVLSVVLTDEEYNYTLVDSVTFLIGDNVYSYNSFIDNNGISSIILGEKGQWLTEAMATTAIKDIAIRVTVNGKNYDFEASEYEGFKNFQRGCRFFNKYFVKYYYNNYELQQYEQSFPLYINGKPVQDKYSTDGKYNSPFSILN